MNMILQSLVGTLLCIHTSNATSNTYNVLNSIEVANHIEKRIEIMIPSVSAPLEEKVKSKTRSFDGVFNFANSRADDTSASPSTKPTMSMKPSLTPSVSQAPSSDPTNNPTISIKPSPSPSLSVTPSITESELPSAQPSSAPSEVPSTKPSISSLPSSSPSEVPSAKPSSAPSGIPSAQPSISSLPSSAPSEVPSAQPSISSLPSSSPSEVPSAKPSSAPSGIPSAQPSISSLPSSAPSEVPSAQPSISSLPSFSPSEVPSEQPSSAPSGIPSAQPSISSLPSSAPSEVPSAQPSISSLPSSIPSEVPSAQPSISSQPSAQHSDIPTSFPSSNPSITSSSLPSKLISSSPSVQPSLIFSAGPTTSPTSKICQDHAETFAVKLSSGVLKNKDCGWVSDNAELRCSLEGASSNCPVTCDDCQVATVNPTTSPTTSPTVSSVTPWFCEDNSESFAVTMSSGQTKNRDCSWASDNRELRCSRDGVSSNCPVTCDSCQCTDYDGKFTTNTDVERDCAWVAANRRRCSFSLEAPFYCPDTCEKCPEANPPSTFPSPQPSVSHHPSETRPSVQFSSTIPLEMTSTSNGMMSENNISLLQDTLNALLLREEETPTFANIQTTVKNQIVRQVSRRLHTGRHLQTESYRHFFDLIVSGEFVPIGMAGTSGSITTEEDAQVYDKLQTYFNDDDHSETLLTALTDTTSSAAVYFRDISSVQYANAAPGSIGTIDDNGGASFWKDNMVYIIISSGSACALLIFVIAMLMYTQSRRLVYLRMPYFIISILTLN